MQIFVTGGRVPPKLFPIKSTHSEVAWVREGRKEINLKNISDNKFIVKCKIVGDGFLMETPNGCGTDLIIVFGRNDCRNIYITFQPTSMLPHKAKLMFLTETDVEMGKNVSEEDTFGKIRSLRAEWKWSVQCVSDCFIQILCRSGCCAGSGW